MAQLETIYSEITTDEESVVRQSMMALVSLFVACVLTCCTGQRERLWQESREELATYRVELDSLRSEFRAVDMPDVPFFLFGMGNRTKFLYKDGKLIESLTGKVTKEWAVHEELIVPSLYRVLLKTTEGKTVLLEEDEEALWLAEGGTRRSPVSGTESRLLLPSFSGNKYSRTLKTLHQEILINIVDGVPLPNYFVYKKAWRRDGAMMAMCLEKTGNVALIKPWVLSSTDPYDRNNKEEDVDNLGQSLYLLSLFTDKNHPAVLRILEEVKKYERTSDAGKYICGYTDWLETPVYQTKFLKWGLNKLGLPDDYVIPALSDYYATLFWWDYKDDSKKRKIDQHDYYPYIGWANAHYYGLKTVPVSNRDYPLTWEIEAMNADYEGMRIIDTQYVDKHIGTPHTWHSSEAFLYLIEM
jgi:hypothetical protein